MNLKMKHFGAYTLYYICIINKQSNKMNYIYDLPNDTLKRLYMGQKNGRLLILNFQRINNGLFRLQTRDLVYNDDFICQS